MHIWFVKFKVVIFVALTILCLTLIFTESSASQVILSPIPQSSPRMFISVTTASEIQELTLNGNQIIAYNCNKGTPFTSQEVVEFLKSNMMSHSRIKPSTTYCVDFKYL